MVVVVNKRHQRKSQRDDNIRRRRLQPRNQPQQIAQQNKQKQRRQVARKPLRPMPDNLLALLRHKLVRHLRQILHPTRLLHVQRHPHQQK